MPVSRELADDPAIVGPLGGVLLSEVRAKAPMMVVRAIRWYRDLGRLGLHLPFFLVHDLGLLYAAPDDQVERGSRRGSEAANRSAEDAKLRKFYASLLDELGESEVAARARSLRLSDDLVTVVLARICGTLLARVGSRPSYSASLPLDPEMVRDLDGQLPELWALQPRRFELEVLGALARSRLHVLTLADAIDLDTLRLLGMLGPESSAASALGHVDLLAALGSPAANDIVNFSLELLPSVLETRRKHAAGTQAAFGYSGLGNKGSVDSLVLTELTWDDAEFARRMVENEILYYTREQAPDVAKRLHLMVIDASASMRGDRQVFARGLAIALAKKLQLQGEEVWFRFFDSRLYDVQRTKQGHMPAAYLLGFKGERGRNPARVFAQLATELALLRAREQRDPVVHIITHAALHVPRELVTEVKRQALLFGVFILPSGGQLDLDWLDLLEGHNVVDHATLTQQKARAAAASKIVESVAHASDVAKGAGTDARPDTGDESIPPSLRGGGASIPPPSIR